MQILNNIVSSPARAGKTPQRAASAEGSKLPTETFTSSLPTREAGPALLPLVALGAGAAVVGNLALQGFNPATCGGGV